MSSPNTESRLVRVNHDAPAIALRGLTRVFRPRKEADIRAVDGVDLTINHGEIVAFLGPNGAGKTTTLDIVLGLTEPTSGSVEVFGADPREAVRAGAVSAVLQTGGLLQDLSVRETVEIIASMFGRLHAVDEVLERAGLTGLAKRRISKCSGGEQQRVRFALALMPDPKILILDEPTAGMDVSARHEFWRTMRAEADQGQTVVFATHYLQEAEDYAERIVLMDHGRIIADGPTAQIRSVAGFRELTVTVSDPDAASARLEAAGATVADRRDNVLTIHTSASDDIARLLLTELGGYDLEIAMPSLDDAFAMLTGPDGLQAQNGLARPVTSVDAPATQKDN